jgi:hypothetical protein
MIKGYLRLPNVDLFTFHFRFTKQYKNGHIQLYDVKFRDHVRYFLYSSLTNTFLKEYTTMPIYEEINRFINSFDFCIKEDWEMSSDEYDYYYSKALHSYSRRERK